MNGRTRNAGKAVIELSLDDRVSQELKKVEARLNKLGNSITQIGSGMAGIGAAILGPLAGAATMFASVGDSLNKMAARTGLSVEALGELKFAAQQSGTSIDVVEKSIRGMTKVLLRAEQGGKGAADKLAALGLTAKDLSDKNPEKQFEILATAVASIQDPSRRAASSMAIFGKAGSDMLPMFADGVAGIKALRNEARELGIVLSEEDATAAAMLTDAMARLQEQFKAVVVNIGAAVAGPMTEFAGKMKTILVDVIDWIKNNSQLITSIGKIGVVAATAGAVVIALGKTFNVAASAVGAVRVALTFLIAHPAIAAMAAIGAAAIFVANEYRKATDAITSFDDALDKSRSRQTVRDAGELSSLSKRFDQLAAKSELTKDESKEARKVISALRTEFGDLAAFVKDGKIANADKSSAQLQAARSGRSDLAQQSDIGFAEASLAVRIKGGAGISEIREREAALAKMRDELSRTQRILADAEATKFGKTGLATAALPQATEPDHSEADRVQLDVTQVGVRLQQAMQALADVGSRVSDSAIELLTPALKGVESVAVRGTSPLAVLDASFASQQFGAPNNKEVDLLQKIADSNEKIKDKIRPNGGLQAI